MFIRILRGCLMASVLTQIVGAQSLYTIPDDVETRWASPENPRGEKGKAGPTNGGRKGSPAFPLKAGEQRVLAEAFGTSGTVRRIWITIDDRSPKMLRGLRLDFFWDGAKTSAVSTPLGDFFGMGLGQMATFQSALFASPEGRSFNCYVPMPFKTGMKMVVTNETDTDQQIGIILPEDVGAFSSSSAPVYKAGPGLVEMDKTRLKPYVLFEREDDWSSCAYFYLDRPENGLPRLAPAERRIEGL
jgi:hypothetical protein